MRDADNGPIFLCPMGLLNRMVLDIQSPERRIINLCWPVTWPTPHVLELISRDDITYVSWRQNCTEVRTVRRPAIKLKVRSGILIFRTRW
jgi:hypothetical protein